MKQRPDILKPGTQPEKTFGYVQIRDGEGNLIPDNVALSKSFEKLDAVHHTSVAHDYSLQNLLPGISARQPFSRRDYGHFRPNEAIPQKYDDIIKACDVLYLRNGLIRYVIDLMSDFGCQGIRLSHPVKSEQKFYQEWFNKVNGQERSERFLNYLYRHNMVTVVTSNAKVGGKTAFADDRRSCKDGTRDQNNMLPEEMVKVDREKVLKGVIPLKYTFLHPCYVHVKNKLEALKQNPEYMYQPPLTDYMAGRDSIPLKKENTYVAFYKKDDWSIKPIPFLWALIPHAIMIDKLNLADTAALDGATSRVRIFKLGDSEKGLLPDDSMVSKLENVLLSNVGGGGIDLIWNDLISMEESKVDVNTFLGKEKFIPHLEQLYIGLGVPPTLIGIGSGTTNNLISLKTFVQRLEYGRQQLIAFWQDQIKKVQKAMGFSKPANIEFDFIDLGEEAAQRKLLMDLADRGLISDERTLELLGHDPDMEKIRVNREDRERRTGRRTPKTSPYHDPQFDISLKKVALQRGYITPEQAGIEIEQEEETPFDKQLKSIEKKAGNGGQTPASKNTGQPGRPKNAKDTQKRKTKTFTPKMKAAKEIWATQAYNEISDTLKPLFFDITGKKNLRQLTVEELNSFEKIKFAALCGIEPFSDITFDDIQAHVTDLNTENYNEYKLIAKQVQKDLGHELTLDQQRQIQILVYCNQEV